MLRSKKTSHTCSFAVCRCRRYSGERVFLQFCGLPASSLLGGTYGDSVQLYKTISCDEPRVMAQNLAAAKKEGYKKFQLKVGGIGTVTMFVYIDYVLYVYVLRKYIKFMYCTFQLCTCHWLSSSRRNTVCTCSYDTFPDRHRRR